MTTCSLRHDDGGTLVSIYTDGLLVDQWYHHAEDETPIAIPAGMRVVHYRQEEM